MKQAFASFVLLFVTSIALGQAENGTADIQKHYASPPAAKINLPYCPLVVKALLHNYMESNFGDHNPSNAGLKSLYKKLEDRNIHKTDFTFLVRPKDAANINESVLYLTLHTNVSTGNQSNGTYQLGMDEAITLLNDIAEQMETEALGMQLNVQKWAVAKAERKQKVCENRLEAIAARKTILQDKAAIRPAVAARISRLDRKEEAFKAIAIAQKALEHSNRQGLSLLTSYKATKLY